MAVGVQVHMEPKLQTHAPEGSYSMCTYTYAPETMGRPAKHRDRDLVCSPHSSIPAFWAPVELLASSPQIIYAPVVLKAPSITSVNDTAPHLKNKCIYYDAGQ